MNITSPLEGDTYTLGDTITLRANIVDDQDPSELEVRWFVDGSPVGTGWEVGYETVRAAELTIELSVDDGTHQVTSDVHVTVRAPSDGDGDDG